MHSSESNKHRIRAKTKDSEKTNIIDHNKYKRKTFLME